MDELLMPLLSDFRYPLWGSVLSLFVSLLREYKSRYFEYVWVPFWKEELELRRPFFREVVYPLSLFESPFWRLYVLLLLFIPFRKYPFLGSKYSFPPWRLPFW